MAFALAAPRIASAQEAPPAGIDVGLPELIEATTAEYPPEARAKGLSGVVRLRLTIDEEGRVQEAVVVAPAGHGFDEAAQRAVLRFRFSPASRAGKAVSARILYDYAFTPPEVEAAPTEIEKPRETPPRRATLVPEAPPIAEVSVRGETAATRSRRSADAVTVIETERAKRESADLGDVVSRGAGVNVRRSGGLGSAARFALNGFEDEQVRFFLDGVPLAYSGFGSSIANVPVGFVERVEIYRGVVPSRFGADALGGAVNLVTEPSRKGTRVSASYQVGSFATYRTSIAAQTYHAPTGLFGRVNLFDDRAKNNYPIDVEVADERGRLRSATTTRFHDRFRANGGGVEAGVLDRSWAKHLSVRLYGSDLNKEVQHNLVMTVPYGEVRYSETIWGTTARFQSVGIGSSESPVSIGAVAGYAHRNTTFVDRADWVYDWFGRRVRPRPDPGEIGGPASDQEIWQDDVFGRLQLAWAKASALTLRATLAPTVVARSGKQHFLTNPGGRDPLSAKRDLFTWINGVEAESNLVERRLQNIVFVKNYLLQSSSEDVQEGFVFKLLERSSHTFGGGDALRFRLTERLDAKASYEHATRLPTPDEFFGNGVLIVPNLGLVPETSDNANVSLALDTGRGKAGSLRTEVNGFARYAEKLVVLLGNDKFFSYQNVFSARSVGVEAMASYRTSGDYLALDGSATIQDFRNTSTDGDFRNYEGDRIPNRPWLFGNVGARVQFPAVLVPRDQLSFGWTVRYVHEFFRTWESQGLTSTKQVIPSQLVHSAALTYLLRGPTTIGATVEVQNVTDAKAFDYFGVQRPGRAFFFKGTIEQDWGAM